MDAYSKLFEHINKDFFFENAISEIIYINNDQIEAEWSNLKHRISNNKEVFIRGYGRDAKGTNLYFELYKHLFGNSNLRKDPTNNSEPTKLLQNLTLYSKRQQKGKQLIMNYQVSHLFGKTKNPLLFTSPWNIAYIPKYLDPFTGHETTGQYSKDFKQILNTLLKQRFSRYIEDYNALINNLNPRINRSLEIVRNEMMLEGREFERFKKDVKNELSEIYL